jgi:NADH-quinone oxidoreductase subunit E
MGQVFKFTADNMVKAEEILAKYPKTKGKSAMLPLLDLAQRQNDNHLAPEVIEYVASFLDTPAIKAYEVASFYTMFNTKPVGKYLLQFCITTPCWLRGSDELEQAITKHLGIKFGETTADEKFTLMKVECLGACVDAPIVQINDDYYENLTATKLIEVIEKLP